MDGRKLIDTAGPLRRGGSGSLQQPRPTFPNDFDLILLPVST